MCRLVGTVEDTVFRRVRRKLCVVSRCAPPLAKVERLACADLSTPLQIVLEDWRAWDRVKESAVRAYWLEKGEPSSSVRSGVLCSTVWSCPFVVWAGDVEGCGLLADGQT